MRKTLDYLNSILIHNLPGCPSPTDSEVKRNFVLLESAFIFLQTDNLSKFEFLQDLPLLRVCTKVSDRVTRNRS